MSAVALVTGGGTGIGAAAARRLASDGFRVCVSGRRAGPIEDVAREIGGFAIQADISNEEDVELLATRVADELGPLDVLVCAAGQVGPGTLVEQSVSNWRAVIDANLTGVFLTCRATLPQLIETKGSLVTISSIGGLRAAAASAAYNSSKAGVVMLTQCIAADHGPDGVRANCVCPGWIRTPMADAEMDALGPDRESAYVRANAMNPLHRPGQAEEVANVVSWLVSAEASYVNGAVLSVDGGMGTLDAGMAAFV